MNAVKILVNKSELPKAIRMGSLLMWTPDLNDFIPAEGKSKIQTIVVMGDSVYNNGRKLTVYVKSPFDSLTMATQNRIPYGSQYERRY